MANVLNQDFTDFITALNNAGVEYLLVGGYAVIFHGYNRTTGDLDVWVNPTLNNYTKIQKAFAAFGMSLFDMTSEKFMASEEFNVFTFGRPPVCIKILTAVKGLNFKEAFINSTLQNFDHVMVRMIDIRDLVTAKKAANRNKDKDDLEHIGALKLVQGVWPVHLFHAYFELCSPSKNHIQPSIPSPADPADFCRCIVLQIKSASIW